MAEKDDKTAPADATSGESAAPATDGAAAPGQDSNAPQAAVLAQYVKDLSFENPKAAQTLQQLAQGQVRPQMQININVGANRVGNDAYEVELKIEATSKIGEETAFAIELVYAGLFGARNLPEGTLEPFLLVQSPTVLFPFARRIIADTVRDGGFAPLMLDPIDFNQLYIQQRQQARAGAGAPGMIDLGEPQGSA